MRLEVEWLAIGKSKAKIKQVTSLAWEVRIRSRLVPDLCMSFPTRAKADEWCKVQDGDIVARRFVDYARLTRTRSGTCFADMTRPF